MLQSVKDSQIWLTKNVEPQAEVLKHWKNSYPLRSIHDKNTTITEYFENWPILKSEIAPELVGIQYTWQFTFLFYLFEVLYLE